VVPREKRLRKSSLGRGVATGEGLPWQTQVRPRPSFFKKLPGPQSIVSILVLSTLRGRIRPTVHRGIQATGLLTSLVAICEFHRTRRQTGKSYFPCDHENKPGGGGNDLNLGLLSEKKLIFRPEEGRTGPRGGGHAPFRLGFCRLPVVAPCRAMIPRIQGRT